MESVQNLRKALNNPLRRQFFTLLLSDEVCECELAEMFDREELHIMLHLKFLEQYDLVESEKRNGWTYYRARSNPVEEALNFVRNDEELTEESWKQLRYELSSVRNNRSCLSDTMDRPGTLEEAGA